MEASLSVLGRVSSSFLVELQRLGKLQSSSVLLLSSNQGHFWPWLESLYCARAAAFLHVAEKQSRARKKQPGLLASTTTTTTTTAREVVGEGRRLQVG